MALRKESKRRPRLVTRRLRARKGVVVFSVALVAASALATSLTQAPAYQATARVFLAQGAVPGDIGAQLQSDVNSPQRPVNTQALLAHTPAVASGVLAVMPASAGSVRRLLANSTVTAQPGGDVLAFDVRDRDPVAAERLATEYARQYTLYRRRLDRLPIEQALAELRHSSGLGGDASVRGYNLQTLQAVAGSGTAGIEPAYSAQKTRPQIARNLVAALLLGTVFGIAAAFLWDALDTRARSGAEIAARLRLAELATVPAVPSDDEAAAPAMLADPYGREAESYRFLRAGLAPEIDGYGWTLMVTSALEGEGESTVAANLAVALARANSHVILVDLDFVRPSLARAFSLEGHPGVTDIALGSVTLGEALATVLESGKGGGPSNGSLRVLTSGPAPVDPTDFQTTKTFDRILEAVRHASEVVLVHAPPLLRDGAAASLAEKVDGLLLVGRPGVVRREAVEQIARRLSELPAPTLGLVAVDAKLGGRARKGRLRRAGGRLTPVPQSPVQ
jgi:Mrp family chromosome partitioning ATPase